MFRHADNFEKCWKLGTVAVYRHSIFSNYNLFRFMVDTFFELSAFNTWNNFYVLPRRFKNVLQTYC